MEVDRYWCAGSHTWASTVFLGIRYLALVGHVPLLYHIYSPCEEEHIARFFATYHNLLVFLLTALIAVLLTMRVYALYFRNRWILCIVALEFIAGMVLACWTLTKLLPGPAVTATWKRARLQAVAFSGLLVFDFTVFVLTMARSIRLWTQKEPFLHRIFIDGLVYYSVIWNLNLVNIIVLLVTNPDLDLSTPIFTNILSVVMISRLMINMRDPALHNPTDYDETLTTSHAGYVSTFMLDDVSTFVLDDMVVTRNRSSPPLDAA
jgi:hypothetical protein